MNLKRHIFVLSALATVLGGSAFASEIYKTTDADGNVHYGDRPSGDPTEERVHITYKRTDASAAQARVQSLIENNDIRRQAAADESKTQEDLRAERAERKAKCDDYRAKLETMVTSRRLYRQDENGERVYLDDAQRDEARQRAEELVAEYCAS